MLEQYQDYKTYRSDMLTDWRHISTFIHEYLSKTNYPETYDIDYRFMQIVVCLSNAARNYDELANILRACQGFGPRVTDYRYSEYRK